MTLYIESFFLTLFLSTIFSLGGVGGAAALIPLLNMMGVPFGLSKATGLFVNISATTIATIMNLKRKALDIKFAIPLVISLTIFLPIGAYLSQFLNEKTMKWMLAGFLYFSATMMMFGKKKAKFDYQKTWILYLVGSIVGIFSGIVGVSGGNLIVATLILLGYDAKKMVITISFIIPFSSMAAFITYANIIHIDWILILVTALAAIIGGFIGNKIMFFNLDSKQIKKIVAILLYFIALKLTYNLI